MTSFSDFSGSSAGPAADFPAGLPTARISLENIRRNWLFLSSLAGSPPPMAVIKADAYGHGLEPVARTLLDAGCRTLAVGSMDEGVLLRRALGEDGKDVTVLPLLGVLSQKDAAAAVANGLVPIVSSARQAAFVSEAWTGADSLPVAVKVETGMSRLGFRATETQEFIAALRSFANIRPVLLLSHLAASDDPAKDASVAVQVDRFLAAHAAMRAFWPDIAVSLANSAGHLARDILLAKLPPHIGRPGFALYGGNPFAGTSREGLGSALLPAMEVAAPVMGVHDLEPGRTVSYGCTFTAPKAMRIAVIGAGYADGFSRGLSSRGHVCIRGRRCPVLGRVCMQMHVADVTHVPGAAVGDAAYILGGEGEGAVSMGDIARDWGTIPYEVFCLLGKNPRVYAG
ncbi:Alanine racemase [uncultured delta proteobacterium]|uniref:Alanine racemase n=1 Tax=uncultured delta proteobacterium TaxID=34034 RepID=A0A212KEM9_9DELT|nr:Alanine racemase [uncultured delta proteobacterium]